MEPINKLYGNSVIRISDMKIINENVIVVDSLLADTIVSLNKSGYITTACCAGHFRGLYYYEQSDCENYFLEEVKKDKHYWVLKEKEKTFDYVSDNRIVVTYIAFAEDYSYLPAPEGFEWSGKSLHHYTKCLDKNDNQRPGDEIEEEIIHYNQILEEWAQSLPKIKDKPTNKKGK